jgi:hypothetical protein
LRLQLQAVLPDPRIKQQLHMRCIVDLMALRIRQDSQIGGKTMLSLLLHQQLNGTSSGGGPSRCSQSLPSRISTAGRRCANRASQAPPCGVATVTTWAAWRAPHRHQAA